MEKLLKTIKIGLLLFTLIFPSQSLQIWAQENADNQAAELVLKEESLTLPRLNESSFYQRIDRKTQKILKDMGGQFTAEERSFLERVRVSTLKFLKEQNPYHHVKDLFLKHGLGVGITAGVTEFMTIIVLPAIFTSAGLPELAVMSAASPSFLATVPAYLGIKTYRIKRKLAQKLGITNIRQLDKLRNDILGYAAKSRVLSVIVARNKQEHEVHIIKRPFARFRKSPMGSVVDINDLKNILRTHEGTAVMEAIKEAAHEDDALHAYLLLKQIQRKPESFKQFHQLIQERTDDFPVTEKQMTQILLTHEKREIIKTRKEAIRKIRATLKTKAHTPEHKAEVKAWANSLEVDLTNLDFDIQRFEYNLLSTIHAEGDITNLDLTSPQTAIVERMKEIREHIEKVTKWIQEEPNNNKLFMRIREYNRLWVPLEVRLTPRGDCYGWMLSVLKNMGHL